MSKPAFLKFKSKCYILILGIINVFGLAFLSGCSSNGNNNIKDRTTDSLRNVKEVNDSISKHKKDSIAQVKKKQDSIAHIDSINKANQNNHYIPVPSPVMYGITPNYKKN
jgi:hypothetical protein